MWLFLTTKKTRRAGLWNLKFFMKTKHMFLRNIARGTTDPGIASITWLISPATKQANSVERKIPHYWFQFWPPGGTNSISSKGAGLFQRAGQTMNQAGGRGTSRYLIGIKNWPELISNWILMRIIFFGHLISHLWRKMAIVWAIFGMIFRLFTVSDAFMLKKGAHSTWIYLTHVRSRIQAILGPLSHKSMAGRRQKWSILDQKWPNMAGLPTFQSGP